MTDQKICVLETSSRFPLVIRGNPTDSEVKGFILEQQKRYWEHHPCGPSGEPAYRITSATWYDSEEDWLYGRGSAGALDIMKEIAPIA